MTNELPPNHALQRPVHGPQRARVLRAPNFQAVRALNGQYAAAERGS